MNNKKESSKIMNPLKVILNYTSILISATLRDLNSEFHLRFYKNKKNKGKKILGCWDFSHRMNASGDIIIFLEIINTLRHSFNLNVNKKNIDFCFIDDENHPNFKLKHYRKPYQWKKVFASLLCILPTIDTVFYFRSNEEFERFFIQNRNRYVKWPPTINLARPVDNRIIERFYKEKGFIPRLNLPDEIKEKIYDFYKSNVYPSLPIVINFRKNERNKGRNSNLNEIKEFLKKYEDNNKFKFIITCYKEEIPPELRSLKNVLFSKDYFEDVESDLGLVQTSYISIVRSMLAVFAWYTGVPCITLGPFEYGPPIPFQGTSEHHVPQKGKTYSFLKKYQRIHHEPESYENLVNAFESLVQYLEKENINNNKKNMVENNTSYRGYF